jgi:general secretion pathway protein G
VGGRSDIPDPTAQNGWVRVPGVASSRARGFTFVEIVIALLIVGVLTAIAVPSYQKYLQQDKEATAVSDITVIALRLSAYMMENPLPPGLAQVNVRNDLPLTDPWGYPYQYVPIYGHPENLNDVRKDHNLHPINTDFDLYSMGPDGQTARALTALKSRDDIIRANDGAFIGKASTYDP